MTNKYYGGIVFYTTVNDKKYVFTCFTQDTRYGFRHVCYSGIVSYPDKYNKPIAKCCYYNRTWEEWTYQSVLREAIDSFKKIVDEDTYNQLYDNIINYKDCNVRSIEHLFI